jgi:glycosyltransferase involved in cell wall biosynthesis
MTMGSGTNLKMLEYMAAGVPVISSPLGARGLGVEHGKHGVICEIDEFPLEIKRLRDDPALIVFRTAAARNLVEGSYDWGLVARKFERELEGLLELTVNGTKSISPERQPGSASVPGRDEDALRVSLQK